MWERGRSRLRVDRGLNEFAVIEDPSGRPSPPRNSPENREPVVGRTDSVGPDGEVDCFFPRAPDRELHQTLDESAPFTASQAVSIKDEGRLTSTLNWRTQSSARGNVIVMQLRVEPDELCEFPERVNWSGVVPIDERHRYAVAKRGRSTLQGHHVQ